MAEAERLGKGEVFRSVVILDEGDRSWWRLHSGSQLRTGSRYALLTVRSGSSLSRTATKSSKSPYRCRTLVG